MRCIGVYTSGGDAPGMNAAIRAVVRTAVDKGLTVVGVERGYAGMMQGEFRQLTSRSVSNIIQLGGTILGSSRCEEFKTKEGRAIAAQKLKEAGIEGLVAIGGNGTAQGAHWLCVEHAIPVILVASTIDNDLYGTDYTIGFDTAVNTALESIDRIRDTAASHDRIFFVEVMGRNCGFIALEAGVAGGTEEILIPETTTDYDALCQRLIEGRAKGKKSMIIIVAEGDECGGAFRLAEDIKTKINLDFRVTVLGHIQRGGSPTAKDRLLATKLGAVAVQALLNGERDKMVGEAARKIVLVPLEEAYSKRKPIDTWLHELAYLLAK